MKKMWIKKDNLYYRPFYKQKYKMTFLLFVVMGFIFLAYQFFWMNQLTIDTKKIFTQFLLNESKIESNIGLIDKLEIVDKMQTAKLNNHIRGVHSKLHNLYDENPEKVFRCIRTKKEIPFEWLNDNYCDCIEDGSDETLTNACANGLFYCFHENSSNIKQSHKISTSRVNDGICDCCDGSDEWLKTGLTDSLVKCKNTCK